MSFSYNSGNKKYVSNKEDLVLKINYTPEAKASFASKRIQSNHI